MKKVLFFLSFIVVIHTSCNTKTIEKNQVVNPILGDISFIYRFGHKPAAGTDENLRIRTHLEYVENVLRHKTICGLTGDLAQKRKQMLDLLHNYWTAGVFPFNYDYKSDRMPCFIDKENRICAVGYLIEKTSGRQTAQQINCKHKYDRILDMHDEMVDDWILKSGLSKEECSMIQPTYGPPPTESYNYISPAYGISSSVIGGLNLSLSTVNVIQISKGADNKTIAIVGLVTGAGQTILGTAMFPKTTTGFYGNTTNESQKTLSMVNIGLGTATMALSTWNLVRNRKPKEKKTALNLNAYQSPVDKIGIVFSLRRKI